MRAGFTATTKINREDFGLTWNMALETGGWLVGKDISITLDVEAIKAYLKAEKRWTLTVKDKAEAS